MGAYLSSPVTTKESTDGENGRFRYGIAAMQGWRVDMEDSHAAVLELDPGSDAALFGVFDGHGGKEVAKFAAAHIGQQVVKQSQYVRGELEDALVKAFLSIDELLISGEYRDELRELCGEKKDERPGGAAAMDGVNVPEGILQYLGLPVPEQGQYRVRVVRPGSQLPTTQDSGNGTINEHGDTVYEIELGNDTSSDEEEDGDAEDDERDASEAGHASTLPASAEDVVGPSPFNATEDADANDGAGKRKRGGKGMQVDGQEAGEGGATGHQNSNEGGATGDQNGSEGGAEAVERGDARGEEGAPDTPIDYVTPDEDGYDGPTAGCTAVCALVTGNRLVVANAGDSRCVLSRKGVAVALTRDHKPNDPEEYARIIRAGGFVADGRVNGSLNLSRALGDMEYKQNHGLGAQDQSVTAFPEVLCETLAEGDEFIILACDGVWDILSNQEAVEFVRERLLRGMSPRAVCEEVCDHCLAPDTSGCGKGCDNMSIIISVLKGYGFPEQLPSA